MEEGTFNPAKRRLCPDGSCVGVIGDDGRCRECGRSADGKGGALSALPSASASASTSGSDHADADADADGAEGDRMAAGASSGFKPDRRLCDDGDCIGVVAPDGVCPVCGRRAGG